MVDAIVIPVVEREFDLLRSWLRYMPRPGLPGRQLFLSIDGHWQPDDAAALREIFERSAFAAEDWTLALVDCGIDPAESFYLRGNASVVDLTRFPYGTKSGPNLQFFHTLKSLRQRRVAGPCLLLEVDGFPTRPDWAAELEAALESTDFLIAGSAYAGQSRLSPDIRNHYNGNSVYNLGHPDFDRLAAAWERLLLHCVAYMPSLAYDVVIEWFRNRHSACGESARADEEFALLLAQPARDLRGLIVNLGGAHESRADYVLDTEAFAAAYPDALVVHGKCFVDSIYTLRGHYLHTVSPPFRNPTNLAMAALQRGEVDEALFSGKLDTDLCETLIDSPALLETAQRRLLASLLAERT